MFFGLHGPGGCPSFSQVGPEPSRCVPLLWTGCVWGLQPFPSPMYSFGVWSPFGSIVSFVTLDRERRFTLVVIPFRYSQPFLGSIRRLHTSSFGLSELLVTGGRAIAWLVTVLCLWAVFSWPHLLLSYEP